MNRRQYSELVESLGSKVTLVAVSKLQPPEAIMHLYKLGHRDFGENYAQELIGKQLLLPNDIRWHFIGHLQANKVKYLAPFIHLIQSVDSVKLLLEINRQASRAGRVIDCLLQVHISDEDTKFGLYDAELDELIQSLIRPSATVELKNIRITGLMGMASLSDDREKVRRQMSLLSVIFDKYASLDAPTVQLQHLSMGMSGDYQLAIEEGSNMVRIGTLLFGNREKA